MVSFDVGVEVTTYEQHTIEADTPQEAVDIAEEVAGKGKRDVIETRGEVL